MYKEIGTYGRAKAVTPHDTNDLDTPCDALYIGTSSSGTLKVNTAGGDTVSFGEIQEGIILPVRCTRVFDTGTTASNIVALYNAVN